MFFDAPRAVGSVADASRQPPVSGRSWLTAGAQRACIHSKLRRRSWCLCPQELRLQRGAHVARAAPGNRAPHGHEHKGADAASRWQTTVELSDVSEYQQEDGPQAGQMARFGTSRPFLPSPSAAFGPGVRAPHPNLLRPTSATPSPSDAGTTTGDVGAGGGGSGSTDLTGDPRPAANVLLPPPSGPAAVPPGTPSPHSRAIGFVSTLASVAAVGAYVYSLVKRRQEEQRGGEAGPVGQPPGKAGFRPGSADAQRAGAGSGLFRPAKAPQAAAVAAPAGALGPAAGPPPGPSLGPSGVAVAATSGMVMGTAAAGPGGSGATAPQPPAPSAVLLGPVQAPSSLAREVGWWRRLGRLYYISFGAQYGLVPRLRMDGAAAAAATAAAGSSSSSSGTMLVAFEGSADAEYVANVLWEDLVQTGVQPPGPRPPTLGVLSAAPMFLEDLAALRGLQVEVVPAESLPKDMHLGGAQLEGMLSALVRGYSPEEAAALAERLLAEAAVAAAAAAAGLADDTSGPDIIAASPSSSSPSAAATAAAAGPSSRSGGGASKDPSAAPSATGPRLPIERAVERQGVKIKLPSKFDFPGFDASPPVSPPAPPVVPSARAASADAAGKQATEAPAAAAAATTAAVAAATAVPAPAAVQPRATAPTEVQSAARAPVGPAAADTAATTTAAATSLPQVEASVVQEPVSGRGGAMGGGDAASDEFSGWMPYGGRVIDAEAVAVEAAPTSTSTAAAAAAPPPPRPKEGSRAASASTEAAFGSEIQVASGSGASGATVPNSELDEAIREYRELETLFATATGTRGGGVVVVSAPSLPPAAVPAVPTRASEVNGVVRDLTPTSAAPVGRDGGGDGGGDATRGSLLEGAAASTAAAAAAESSTDSRRQSAESQTREEVQPTPTRKSGAEIAKEILEKRGPTDAALEAAMAAIEAGQYRPGGEDDDDDDMLDEYYSIFNTPNQQQQQQPSSVSSGDGAAATVGPRVADGGGGGIATGDVAAAVAEVQQQLASVVQAVAVAHVRGLPPPVDATANMQRLQLQLQDLQDRLKATPAAVAASTTTAAAAPPPPPPRAAAPRQSGSLFSAPASFRPPSSSSSSKGSTAASSSDGTVSSSIGGSNGSGGSTSTSASTAGGSGATASAATQPAAAADQAALVTPLSTAPGAATADAQAAGGGKAGARRAWGAWKTNRRIQEAEATLLKTATRATTLPPSQPDVTGTRQAAAAAPRPSPSPPPPQQQQQQQQQQATAAAAAQPITERKDAAQEKGVKVLSKRVGTNRPPKVVEAPEARQDRVKEALRVFSEMTNDPSDEEGGEDELFGRSASLVAGGRKPWWQQRFQALFLPTVGYPDGSVGFVQVNVALVADRRDMRVLAFEDRTDCTACLALMAQWPEYDGTEPRMSMMPTDKLLPQLQEIYDEQTDLNSGVSRPRGLAVFRRGKLPMRPGMGPDDFLQAVVYQHAAQVALARTGYGFDS